MAHLVLALLGHFQATLDDRPVEGLNSDYLRALLAYLAVESKREHPREQVAALLWSERSDQEALTALRYALSNLHQALEDRRSPSPYLLVTRNSLQFNPASDHWLDLSEFQNLSSRPDVSRLEQATALYRGPFLDGLSIADSPAFEEWMLLKGEEIRRSLLALLDRLTVLQMRAGETGQAARWARKQLELEPYHEQAHRQLMRVLALGGERLAALAHYEACCRLLAEELGIKPEDETQALYAQIRDGVLPPFQAIPLILTGSHTPGPPTAGSGHAAPGAATAVPAAALPAPCFVSRQVELARLGGLLDRALTSRGGLALIAGEAGSGKTALLDEFSRQAGQARPDLIALRGRCNAHAGSGDPYLPFREMLQTLAGDVESKRAGGTLSPEQARRVWEALPVVGAALGEHGPDLIDRFVPGEALLQRLENFSTPGAAARWQKRLRELGARSAGSGSTLQPDLLAQVTQVLHVLSLRFPLLLAVDDLQWADGGTLALLFHLGRRLVGSRILLVCAYRPLEPGRHGEQAPELGVETVVRELRREWGDVLIDLERADGRAFVEALIESEPNCLGTGFRRKLYDHTGGNPLFTIELLHSFENQRMIVQDEAGRWVEAPGLDWDYCPPQVEAVIAGNLAGLPDEDLELLQAAAVQGEQFVAEVAARVLGRGEETVLQRLGGPLRRQHRLVEAVSLERLAVSGKRLSYYRFRHALLQRGAYNSLDAIRRPQLHEATGHALETTYAEEGERPQSLALALARHYEAAGLNLAAARALHEAGCQAMRLTALRQALDLFDHGLALLAGEPPSVERTEIEQRLQVTRLGPQARLGGIGSSQLASSLAKAADAAAGSAGGQPKLLMLHTVVNLLNARGQFEEGLAAVDQMLEEATRCGDESFTTLAHYWSAGHLHHLMGRFQEADSRFESAIARLTPELGADLRAATGAGVAPLALSFSALNRWMLGYPERALERSAAALAGAIEQGDLYGQAFASAIGSMTLFLLRNESAALQARAEPAYRLCLQQGIAWWQDYLEAFLGWLAVERGDDTGIERMRGAIAAWQATGTLVGTDGLLVLLADGCLAAAHWRQADDHEGRARLLAIGLAEMEPFLGPSAPCGQSFQAELCRMRGELLLERDGLAAAEEALDWLQRALELARKQGALGWELRAAMSLVRLRMRQGEAYAAELAEARACLRDLYDRFTEGFEFPDLQEAAALIGQAG